ncbi:hypothetical protein [Streptomyces smyrnaeus]|uniref:hypothetical protein n=1 Tax=Streptomyces smyrnaeus TaxID=1387713 RepID=UPI0033D114CD
MSPWSDEQANPAKVAAAYDKAHAALAALLAAVDGHDDAVREAATLLRKAGAPPMTRYVTVQRGEYAVQEPERVPAARTAPTVDERTDVLALEIGRHHGKLLGGPVIATLLEEVTQAHDARMPFGQPPFTRAPLSEHAGRNRDQVRGFLDRAKGGETK